MPRRFFGRQHVFGWPRQDISLAASISTGAMIFIPVLPPITEDSGWKPVAAWVAPGTA
ncbi:MAG TPA: hypothetical protein VJP60_06330 [Rhizomicrobium sp.]|nr:hypothetical protein [Rhizomicrobium sp.]